MRHVYAELHLRKARCNSSTCGLFTKHHELIQKFRKTGNLRHIYKNKLDRACFAYDTAYSDS